MVINFTNSAGGQVGTISAAASGFLFSGARLTEISSPVLSIIANSLTLSASSSLSLKKGSYVYSLPNKTGTVALTTDIKPVYLLTLYWASKKTQTIPDITANMYVSYLASGLSLGSNTFVGSQLSQAVTNILLGDYFSAKNPSLKIVASGCSIYNDNINICEYITYYDNAGTDMLVANLTRNSTSGKINLGDVTSFSTLNIYVTQLS